MITEYRVKPQVIWAVVKVMSGDGCGGIQTIARTESKEMAVEIAMRLSGGEDAVTVDPPIGPVGKEEW